MAKKIEIYSKDETLLAIVDTDYNITETHVHIPAIDAWIEMNDSRVTERAEKLVQEYIVLNEIKLPNQNDCDDLGSQSYIRFANNF